MAILIKKPILLTVSSFLFLAACAPTIQPTKPDPVFIQLAKVSEQISHDLAYLKGIEQTRTSRNAAMKEAVAKNSNPQFGSLLETISIKWYGPAETSVKMICEMIGYSYSQVGKAPSQPIMVKIDAVQRPAHLVLADIGWQMGDAAGLSVKQSDKQVQVVYVGK